MPDETAIRRMEELLVDITRLGGENERTSIVPNLSVVDAAPTGLTNFITVADDRDGDTILAKTVPGVIYAASDKVNVLFIEGTEPIAYQQGSESPNAGLWEIVPSTSTDIFYNNGDVGIGKAVAPDASLEILDTVQAQLRLTHTEDTKFVDLTLDTNHDLTITPSSTGQVIFQPTTDSTDFFQVLDADGGTPILNIDSTNERVGIGIAAPENTVSIVLGAAGGILSSDVTTDATTKDTRFLLRHYTNAEEAFAFFGGASLITSSTARFGGGFGTQNAATAISFFTAANNTTLGGTERARVNSSGDMGVGGGLGGIAAQLDVDQNSTTAAQPVLKLDQADVSEEFIEFVGTAAAANLTRSLVDEGDVTTATRIGWFKISVDDVGNQITDGAYFVPFYSLA